MDNEVEAVPTPTLNCCCSKKAYANLMVLTEIRNQIHILVAVDGEKRVKSSNMTFGQT